MICLSGRSLDDAVPASYRSWLLRDLHCERFGKKVFCAEIARFEREQHRRRRIEQRLAHLPRGPRHTRINGLADLQLLHTKRIHHCTRGLAAGDDETPDLLRDQALCNIGKAMLDLFSE